MNEELMYEFTEAFQSVSAVSGLSSTLSVLCYVFVSLGIYTIAQRRGIRKPWLAWVPVANLWIWGSISDQYRYVVKGQVKSKRKVLLSIGIANLVLGIILAVWMIVLMVQAVQAAMQGPMGNAEGMMLVRKAFAAVLLALPMLVLGIVSTVFEYMALYDIYTSCDPTNSVLYLVLSIIPAISYVTLPLFLFLCRNQDNGMPPRKPNPVPNIDFVEAVPYEETPQQEF